MFVAGALDHLKPCLAAVRVHDCELVRRFGGWAVIRVFLHTVSC